MKTLIEYIESNIITEIAKSLSDFKQLVSDLSDQIVENWCLVKWCDIYPDELTSKRLRNHLYIFLFFILNASFFDIHLTLISYRNLDIILIIL